MKILVPDKVYYRNSRNFSAFERSTLYVCMSKIILVIIILIFYMINSLEKRTPDRSRKIPMPQVLLSFQKITYMLHRHAIITLRWWKGHHMQTHSHNFQRKLKQVSHLVLHGEQYKYSN